MRKPISQTAINALTFAKTYYELQPVYLSSAWRRLVYAVLVGIAIILWMWVLSQLIRI